MSCAIDTNGAVWCWGSGYLGDGSSTSNTPVAVTGSGVYSSIAVRSGNTCAIDGQHQVWCWGTILSGLTPTAIPDVPDLHVVATGEYHTCGLSTAGRVTCWGERFQGQCGVGGDRFGSMDPQEAGGWCYFRKIASNDWTTCAIDLHNKTFCWGQLPGTVGSIYTKKWTEVPGNHRFTEISLGNDRVCAIDESQQAWCWGSGALGNGTNDTTEFPVAVTGGHLFERISAGGLNNTCAVDTEQRAWCWGTVPTLLGGEYYSQVSAGHMHSCAIDLYDNGLCWGENIFGQIGDGAYGILRQVPAPVVGGHLFSYIDTTSYFSCALDLNGQAWCWGDNYGGRLGLGPDYEEPYYTTPMAVIGDHVFEQLSMPSSSMEHYACALDDQSDLWCWGNSPFHSNDFTPFLVERSIFSM